MNVQQENHRHPLPNRRSETSSELFALDLACVVAGGLGGNGVDGVGGFASGKPIEVRMGKAGPEYYRGIFEVEIITGLSGKKVAVRKGYE